LLALDLFDLRAGSRAAGSVLPCSGLWVARWVKPARHADIGGKRAPSDPNEHGQVVAAVGRDSSMVIGHRVLLPGFLLTEKPPAVSSRGFLIKHP
jgi:hypothetical protein